MLKTTIMKDIMEFNMSLKNLDVSQLSLEEQCRVNEQIRAIKIINEYVQVGEWCKPESRTKYVALLRNRYDYATTAAQFNTTVPSLHTFAYRQNKRLESILRPVFELIKSGYCKEGITLLNKLSGALNCDDIFCAITDIVLPQNISDIKQYSLHQCRSEIYFLKYHSKNGMCRLLSRLDSQKICYLLSLLNTDNADYQEQQIELLNTIMQDY